MSYDLLTKKTSLRDWSCGAGDLPAAAEGYAPESFWGPAEMERKLAEIMSKGKGLFGTGAKPTRAEAIVELVQYMKAHRIGPRDVTSGISSEVGAVLFPDAMRDKIDDLRYDVRNVGGSISAGIFALAGAFTFLSFAKIYKAAQRRTVS